MAGIFSPESRFMIGFAPAGRTPVMVDLGISMDTPSTLSEELVPFVHLVRANFYHGLQTGAELSDERINFFRQFLFSLLDKKDLDPRISSVCKHIFEEKLLWKTMLHSVDVPSIIDHAEAFEDNIFEPMPLEANSLEHKAVEPEPRQRVARQKTTSPPGQ